MKPIDLNKLQQEHDLVPVELSVNNEEFYIYCRTDEKPQLASKIQECIDIQANKKATEMLVDLIKNKIKKFLDLP